VDSIGSSSMPKSSRLSSVLRFAARRARQDAHHAGHALGGAGVDPADARGVVRRARAAHVQQPFEQVVVIEGRAAGDMAGDVLPPRRLADLVEVVVAFVGEEFLAELDHVAADHRGVVHARHPPSATSRIAAMIGS
jgi:hypothetical protein